MRTLIATLVLLVGAAGGAALAQTEVDLELVLAVDVSLSMDVEEQAVQRQGYLAAITDPAVLAAIAEGPNGRIAVTYVEWAGVADQQVVVAWRLVDGQASAEAFAAELSAKPIQRLRRTSVSGALLYSANLFDGDDIEGLRRVIDISGDGANNQGPSVTLARDQVVERGITINGLPLLMKRPSSSYADVGNLDQFYEDCVIGGPSAFMIAVRSVDEFREAIRNKLVLEIAGDAPPAPPLLQRASAEQRAPCDIGERQWQNWMRDGYQ